MELINCGLKMEQRGEHLTFKTDVLFTTTEIPSQDFKLATLQDRAGN